MTGQPTSKPTCPSCGAEVPPDAPRGYCLKCLFALGTAAPDSVAGTTSPITRDNHNPFHTTVSLAAFALDVFVAAGAAGLLVGRNRVAVAGVFPGGT